MYPDTPYAEGRGSFLRPIPQIITNPSDAPTKTVSINCDWLPAIRGALQQLLLQATWQPGFPGLDTMQGRAFDLIDLFSECTSPVPPFVCSYDFTHAATGAPWAQHGRGGLASPTAHFQPGVGWQAVDSANGGGSQHWMCLTIYMLLGVHAEISIVEYAYTGLVKGTGGCDPTGDDAFIVLVDSSTTSSAYSFNTTALPDGDGVVGHDFGGFVADEIRISLPVSVCDPGPATGGVNIAGINVTGHVATSPCP